jgi:hypothetical protein
MEREWYRIQSEEKQCRILERYEMALGWSGVCGGGGRSVILAEECGAPRDDI